jgi:DNA topoisomerase-1
VDVLLRPEIHAFNAHHDAQGRFAESGLSRGADTLWRRSDGTPVSDDTQARLTQLRVPPAWTHVKLSADPTADLQATGEDSKGRTQYLYSAEHAAQASAEKFERLKEFNTALPGIRETLAVDLNNPNATALEREAAAVLTLIDKTGFRIGSEADTGAEKQAYGASTLQAEHVTIDGDTVTFTFVGKKGVDITKELRDPALAAMLEPRVAAGGKLFNITDGQVRDYLKEKAGDFKVKDFRTWNGTSVALSVMQSTKAPATEKEFKAAQKAVATRVAEHLGNTPAVALQSYIDPSVWGPWRAQVEKRITAAAEGGRMADRTLTPDEMAEHFDAVTWSGPVRPWRDVAETGDDPDDEEIS